ncbi:MAG TPA: hypothetical protein VFQ60_00305 [Patescibacteria group bacterium]|nr:hypothetical protein [Patescibacteria group bacterium]
MRKLGPGCNEEGWKTVVSCAGERDEMGGAVGCGAPLEIEKADLYLVHQHDISGSRDEVKFTCPSCGVENKMPDGEFFRDLPMKEDWLKKRSAGRL